MKTQFLSFGGGLITGLSLLLVFSASTEREETKVRSVAKSSPVQAEFTEVPIGDFFQDVANYRDEHVRRVQSRLPAGKLASRMFIYSVPVLESFFEEIRRHARTAQIKPDELAIRFYYAAYPRRKVIDGQDYGLLHTLFMVPNYWSQQDRQFKDFDIRGLAAQISKDGYGNNANNKEVVIREYYLESLYQRDRSATALMLDASAFSGSTTQTPFSPGNTLALPPVINQGQLCPPNCPNLSLLSYIDQNFPPRR